MLDPRLNAFRPDLADARLKGTIDAVRFVEGNERRVVANSAAMKRTPRPDASLDSEVLRGETVTVFEDAAEGWSWGQLATDGYVGYVPTDALASDALQPTHRVAALRTFIYSGPDLKTAALGTLSFRAAIALGRETVTRGSPYCEIAGGEGWIAGVTVAPVATPPEPDFVAVAERFLHTPYLWGGRTSIGLDCSSLVQLSLAAAGHAAPRDTDLQEKMLGEAIDDIAALKRGDLVFWKGHVAIAIDGEYLVHASGHHMAVVIEPLAATLERVAPTAGQPTSIRRI